MVKPKRRRTEAISLFPFLSILACVIGVLTLIITAMALGQLQEQPASSDDYKLDEEYQKLEGEIEVDEQELERIKKAIADAEKMSANLAAARQEMEQLQADQLARSNVEQTRDELILEVERFRQQAAEIERQLAERTSKLEVFREELKLRKAPPKAAQVVVRQNDRPPESDAPNLKYTVVECRNDRVVIYGGEEPTEVPRGELGKRDQAFFQVVERVAAAQDEGACLLLLVRDDSHATFTDARRIARSRRCLTSKLPLPGQGDLDLSGIGSG